MFDGSADGVVGTGEVIRVWLDFPESRNSGEKVEDKLLHTCRPSVSIGLLYHQDEEQPPFR